LLLAISLEGNYCIQVLTTNKSEKNSVIRQASSEQYSKFDDVRVESRGRYLVFRIGDYARYKDARRDIYELKKLHKDAYIRKCDFIREKALYVKDNFQSKEEVPNYYQSKPNYIRTTAKREEYRAPQVKKDYKKRKKIRYESVEMSGTLWGECKKCFVPVYKEDSEENYPELYSKKKSKHKVKQQKTPLVEIKEKPQREDTFWKNEIRVQESVPRKIQKPRRKPKNKFNIDEKFLP